jgi:hypothetical protein
MRGVILLATAELACVRGKGERASAQLEDKLLKPVACSDACEVGLCMVICHRSIAKTRHVCIQGRLVSTILDKPALQYTWQGFEQHALEPAVIQSLSTSGVDAPLLRRTAATSPAIPAHLLVVRK